MSLHDDPRLTAYALGELNAAERLEIEALIENDPAAQAEVEAIQAMAALLDGELGGEAEPIVDDSLRADVLEGPQKSRTWMLWASGLTAAAAAVGLFVISPQFEPAEAPNARMATGAEAKSATSAASAADEAAFYKDRAAVRAPASRATLVAAPGTYPPVAPATGPPTAVTIAAPVRRMEPPILNDGPSVPRPKVGRTPRSQAKIDAMIDGLNNAHYAQRKPPKGAPLSTLLPTLQQPATDHFAALDVNAGSKVNGRAALANQEFAGRRGPLQIAKETKPVGGLLNTALVDNLNPEPIGRDQFTTQPENPFTQPTLEPLSTFSIDVDTASYSMVRSQLTSGRRPQPGAVRIEELLNYFEYDYAPPVDGQPFATHVEVAAAPWAPTHRLVRIGLKGKTVVRPRANLVFLLDVSGSMSARNKLPLLKGAMATLVDTLHPDDRVAIVVYAGASGLVLPSTPAKDKREILRALDRLKSGGGTNGGAGINQAYWVAAQNYIEGGVNRVIIGTDGDFNVGTTSQHALVQMVEQKAQGGIALTVLGFGMGNQNQGGYNDATLEQLADKGDGNYAYIDTADEARKVLVDQLDGTLVTIAKDVKIQVEFNPARVAAYRLIGYENRKLAAQDFNDDTKDAGEIGAGHTVTALYEVIPTGVAGARTVDPLRYQPSYQAPKPAKPGSREMLTIKLRYKAPTGGKSQLISGAIVDDGASFQDASADLRFAASVAAFGMILRGSPHAGAATIDTVLGWASDAVGKDEWRYRQGFLDLVRRARRVLGPL
ncbi:MAG: Ca-activated chloride channel family protein [Bradymonadia bacterium]|jgi:Ca-activated chloride channel family protein